MWARHETQAELARHLDITPTTLSKKLRGMVPITVDELAAVAEFLEVEVGGLLGEDPLDPAAMLPRAAVG